MLFWIFACLALYLVYIYVPTWLYLPTEGVGTHLGGRDQLPVATAITGRARRAQANFQENLPLFLTLAILTLVLKTEKMDVAVWGAMVFVVARVAYLPFYLAAVPFARSAAYGVSMVGLGIMVYAIAA
jgi:uncharacterized MAPEG superfamily protein